ncbi:hypothetical protein B484DRAFT_157875, partial [Ochromonadaceae sp. CCMP2298]
MEFIADLEEQLSGSLDDCNAVLDHPESEGSAALSASKSFMAASLLQIGKIDMSRKEASTIGGLKKLNAHAVATMLHGEDLEAKVLAARVVLACSALPSASAFGVCNSNVLYALVSSLNRIVGAELKTVHKEKRGDKKEGLSLDLGLDKGSRSSQRVAGVAAVDAVQEEESDEEEDKNDPFAAPVRAAPRTSLKAQDLAALVRDLSTHVGLLSSQSADYILNASADLLTGLLYLCAGADNGSGGYRYSAQLCERALVSFGAACRGSLVACYRSLMPVLTMATRNALLPDNAKIRRVCHKAAVAAIVLLVQTSCNAPHLALSPSTAHVLAVAGKEEGNDGEEEEEDEGMDVSPGPSSPTPSSPTPQHTLPFAHTCLVGVMQRISLSPPDRAPLRALLLGSLVDVAQTLAKEAEGGQRRQSGGGSGEGSGAALHALQHFAHFLRKLSLSAKVQHRAFALDVAAQLLGCGWFWSLGGLGASTAGYGESVSEALLEVLLGRCRDCAPAVRGRALSALHDLLLSLKAVASDAQAMTLSCGGYGGSVGMGGELLTGALGAGQEAMVCSLLDCALGVRTTHTHSAHAPSSHKSVTQPRESLIDLLRARTTDDKPLVRTKALQALGLALSMPWPKLVRVDTDADASVDAGAGADEVCGDVLNAANVLNTSVNTSDAGVVAGAGSGIGTVLRLEWVEMLVLEEDVEAFTVRCADPSVSVRKQALVSLGEMLSARAASSALQDAWLTHVLPMVYDGEASVASKVAEEAHTLLFANLVNWHKEQLLRLRSRTAEEEEVGAG